MTTRRRLDAMMIVRRADERIARAAYVEAAADAMRQADMARRLGVAATEMELPAGMSAGALLAAKGELAGRIQRARGFAMERVAASGARFGAAAQDRRAARIAIEQIEVRQAADQRARALQRAAKMPPVRGSK
jgi:hypothetical protein